jgi:hypothetical protein
VRRARLARLRLHVAAGLALCALSAAGCTAARNTLGTNSSPCFRALAIAKDAVHDRGTFAGVRLVSAASLAKYRHLDMALARRSSTPIRDVCLVSYRGTFGRQQVERPAGHLPPSGIGHFAVVVVSSPANRLLATFVLARQPLRFQHITLRKPELTGRAVPSGSA